MKNIVYIAFIFLFLGCSSDSSWDCIQKAGNIVQTEVAVPEFTKILVWERTKLFVQQGDIQKVVIESGENLMSDVEVSVTNGLLEIHNNNACNLVRDYGLTKVYVTTPNITEIRSNQYHVDGDFKLNLEVENLIVTANGLSKIYLNGSANKAIMGLYSGDCRIYSEDLIVQNLTVYNRSTGPMVVNPQQSIKGQIVSLGDVISKNRPPIVEVEELYRGRLIFE